MVIVDSAVIVGGFVLTKRGEAKIANYPNLQRWQIDL